jgi:hypothetical protein
MRERGLANNIPITPQCLVNMLRKTSVLVLQLGTCGTISTQPYSGVVSLGHKVKVISKKLSIEP